MVTFFASFCFFKKNIFHSNFTKAGNMTTNITIFILKYVLNAFINCEIWTFVVNSFLMSMRDWRFLLILPNKFVKSLYRVKYTKFKEMQWKFRFCCQLEWVVFLWIFKRKNFLLHVMYVNNKLIYKGITKIYDSPNIPRNTLWIEM